MLGVYTARIGAEHQCGNGHRRSFSLPIDHRRARPWGSTIRKKMISAPKIMNVRCDASAVAIGMPKPDVGSAVQTIGSDDDERGAEEAAHDRAQTADDDHEQQLERTIDDERRRLPRAQVDEAPQRAGHADEERADREGCELGVHRTDADHLGGHVHVADRHPLAADGLRTRFLASSANTHHEAQTEQVLLGRRVDGPAEDLQVRPPRPSRRRNCW